jgi:hypothetical protein
MCILGLGVSRSEVYHCMYFKQVSDYFIYMVLYVDDMFLIGNNKEFIKNVKAQLSSEFDMKDLWCCKIYFGHGD